MRFTPDPGARPTVAGFSVPGTGAYRGHNLIGGGSTPLVPTEVDQGATAGAGAPVDVGAHERQANDP